MITSFIPQIISALFALITYRLYSELLDSVQLGEAMLALGGIALFDAICSSSVSQTVFYFGSKPNSKKGVYYLLNRYKNYTLIIGLTLIISIIFLESIKTNELGFYVIFFLILIGYIIIEPSRNGMFSLLNIVASRKVYGVQVVIDATVTFLFIFIFLRYDPNWVFLILGILVSRFISLISNSLLLKNIFKGQDISNINLQNFHTKKEVFQQMRPIMYMGILGWLSAFADRYVIAGSIGLAGSGVYSLATGLVGRPYTVSSAALTAHFRPSLYNHLPNEDKKDFYKTAKSWLIIAFVIGLIGVILFYLMGGFLVDILLSKEYRNQIEGLLFIIGGAFTFMIMTHSLDNKFLAKGKGDKLFRLQLYLSPIPFAGIISGAILAGVYGAVLGKLVSDFIKFIITYYYSKRI